MRVSLPRFAGVCSPRRHGRGAGAGGCAARPPPPRAPAPCALQPPGGSAPALLWEDPPCCHRSFSLPPRARIKSLLGEADGWGENRGGARTAAPPSAAAPGRAGRGGMTLLGQLQNTVKGGRLSPRPFIFFLTNFIWFARGTSGARQGGGCSAAIACLGRPRRASPETELPPCPCARGEHGDVGERLP